MILLTFSGVQSLSFGSGSPVERKIQIQTLPRRERSSEATLLDMLLGFQVALLSPESWARGDGVGQAV